MDPHLRVAELPPRLVVMVLGHPRDRGRSNLDGEREPVAVADRAAAFQHLGVFPGRHEPLERAGPLVPGERLFNRHGQVDAAEQQLFGHGGGTGLFERGDQLYAAVHSLSAGGSSLSPARRPPIAICYLLSASPVAGTGRARFEQYAA